MPITLLAREETLGGPAQSFPFVLPTEELTVRDLLHERVHQSLSDREAREPTESPAHDRNAAHERACAAFTAGQLLVLVDDRQVATLDERVRVNTRTEVTFLRLAPLVGG
jgi:hypothetical protein